MVSLVFVAERFVSALGWLDHSCFVQNFQTYYFEMQAWFLLRVCKTSGVHSVCLAGMSDHNLGKVTTVAWLIHRPSYSYVHGLLHYSQTDSATCLALRVLVVSCVLANYCSLFSIFLNIVVRELRLKKSRILGHICNKPPSWVGQGQLWIPENHSLYHPSRLTV